jgi:signal transduction histidine kinase
VYNLIENSLRHGEHVTEIRITFSVEDENNGILTFKDNGVGVPDEDKERIFDMGFGKNTGLGLFLTREILDLSDIKIHECGQFGQGAQFDLIIPSGYWKW